MAIVKVVKLVQVEHGIEKEGGKTGTYTVTELTYKDNGKPFVQRIFEHEKSFTFKASKSLKAGDTVEMTLEKEAGNDGIERWQLKKLRKTDEVAGVKPGTKPGSTFTKDRGSFADNAIGQQVGNALTNATTLLAHDCQEVSGMTLIEAARHIISVGEVLKAELSKRDMPTPKAEKKVEAKPKPVQRKREPEPESDMEEVEDEEIDY